MIERGAVLQRLGDGHDHAAVLERAGRVHALELEVQLAHAQRGGHARRGDQRRVALVEGQQRRPVGDRQKFAVALQQHTSSRL